MKKLEDVKKLFEKEEGGIKVKMTLKKKLLIGGGILVTGIVGVLAYGKKKQNDTEDVIEDLNVDYDDENDEVFESEDTEEVILDGTI